MESVIDIKLKDSIFFRVNFNFKSVNLYFKMGKFKLNKTYKLNFFFFLC